MAKVNLADRLAGQLTEPDPEVAVAPVDDAPEVPAAAPIAAVAAPAPAPASRRPRKRAAARSAPPEPAPEPSLPRYLQMQRIEGRVTLGQSDALDMLVKRLNRARGRGVGERITANTLIRVGVDLLLANTDRLAGTTEDELRRSLGLTESVVPVVPDR